jgi:type IV pilus assembly protein PilY1
MRKRNRREQALAVVLVAALLLGVPATGFAKKDGSATPPPPLDPSGDDLFLLTASTSPNVVLLMDNSRSMHQIEWHPAFDPEKTPDASYCTSSSDLGGALDPDEVYEISGDMNNVKCDSPVRGNRTVYGPHDPTLWSGRYLMWYLGLENASPVLDAIENAVADVEGCTQAGGAKFFDEKYRRTRLEASKQVLLDLLCVAEPKNVRFSLAYYRETEDAGDEDPNGGFLVEDLGRSNPSHAAELEAAIKNVDANDDDVEATPLSESLFQIYTYWMSRDSDDVPEGADGVTKFPVYQYNKHGGWETDSNKFLDDALLHDCEKAFVVVVTDGQPTRDDFDVEETSDEAAGFADFANLIGDYHDEGADAVADAELPGDAAETSWYLDDIAKYMQDHDLRPDLGGDQLVDTYTIGLATDAATDAYLGMTAEMGNGLFFHVDDGDQLTLALIRTLNDIIEKAASFTAAAVPSARTVDGGDFYQSYFFPSGRSAFWEGHVRAWRITSTGDVVDKNGNCALDDPDPGECNSGAFKPEAVYNWDAAEEVPAPASRTLYASKLVSGESTRVAFDDGLTAADLTVEPFADESALPPDISPNSPLFQLFGSEAKTAEGLADEIVQYVRGCFFGTGVTDGTLSFAPQACLARPGRLGDIFHSNPIVVRKPDGPNLEESYKAFETAYQTRSRVIYAGTNAGFLEAFDSGTWQSAATPPRYDAGTGAELFGFMPWEPRRSIENLVIDSPTDRGHYVDGSPQVSDVWIYPNATATAKAANGSEWRTMLVGGLRRGGRHYYAIDITNPDGIAGPGGTTLAYPGFQASGPAHGWEFPKEGDPDGYLPLMGLSWAQPIITKVKVGVDGDGVAHERWVAVFTAGYDENGDPNPQEVTGRVSSYDATKTNGRAIFMIDMKTGGVLARKKLDATATDAQTGMLFVMPSTPAVFDLDGDGFADVIYVGSMGGSVFKWVVQPLGGDPINGSGAGDDANQPTWPFKHFFQAPVADDGGTLYFQNFFNPPAGALYDGKLWLAFGAGERKDLPYLGDAGIDENNRFYVVTDPDPLETGGSLGTVLESDLVDATASPGGVSLSSERGFYIKAEDGEKFVTGSVIFAGKVITASFKPTPSADPCAARGEASAYIFDVLTGKGAFTDDSNNPYRKISIGVGLPTDPKVSVGVGGKDNRVYIEKSGADLESIGTENVPAGGRLLYWRELR